MGHSLVLVSTMFALRLVPRGVAKKGVISKKRGMPCMRGTYHVICRRHRGTRGTYHAICPASMPRFIPRYMPQPPAARRHRSRSRSRFWFRSLYLWCHSCLYISYHLGLSHTLIEHTNKKNSFFFKTKLAFLQLLKTKLELLLE